MAEETPYDDCRAKYSRRGLTRLVLSDHAAGGSSWADMAQYPGIDAAQAEERFGPDIDRRHTAFEVPYRLDETGRKRIHQLPTAAYHPCSAARRLDRWANSHVTLLDDDHPVSGHLTVEEST
ncbi:hypothetical protein FCH28_15140 [Streptomyces piniterrae]|uniref:Uncharacterized protein n=1 Tax=Streptomyces piniterrae TaxID=2571125 RepID=A0A4U0NJJ8_9ACTN|nr:hypothetical protein [Streptomyces piniterrae]TJZ54456.1 hypothetical protein FCH28_15140 [Streptomyces piniterrae]